MRQGLGIAIVAVSIVALAPSAPAAESRTQAELDAKNGEIVLDHYPPASLKAGEEGVVHFRVTLAKDGGLTTCAVTKSSGFPRLDTATCDMIVATARFRRSPDDQRQRTTHDGSVVWKLPEGLVKAVPPTPAPEAPAASAEALADAALICRRTNKLGSLYIKTKLCLTKEDWERARENARNETKDMQTPKGKLFGY